MSHYLRNVSTCNTTRGKLPQLKPPQESQNTYCLQRKVSKSCHQKGWTTYQAPRGKSAHTIIGGRLAHIPLHQESQHTPKDNPKIPQNAPKYPKIKKERINGSCLNLSQDCPGSCQSHRSKGSTLNKFFLMTSHHNSCRQTYLKPEIL